MSKLATLHLAPFRFTDFNKPEGWLVDEPACHALMYYAILVRRQLESFKDEHVYEGELWNDSKVYNQKQLFSSIAVMYGVAPEKMVKFWSNVDMQFAVMQSSKIPAPFRFDQVAEVN